MGASKLSSTPHQKTQRMGAILNFAVLEWTLISLLLLLNGLFSYLIQKFAAFFGLKPPCIFCSRVDRVLEPEKSYRDLLCNSHFADFSRPRYCSNHHRKLAGAGDMCESCSSSRPQVSSMKGSEEDEKGLRCSCCNETLDTGFDSASLIGKQSWGVLEITQKGNFAEGLGNGVSLAREWEEQDQRVFFLKNGEVGDDGEGKKNGGQHVEEGETGNPISEQDDHGEFGDIALEGEFNEQETTLVSIVEIGDIGSSDIFEMVGVGEDCDSLPPAVNPTGDCLLDDEYIILEIQHCDETMGALVFGDDSVEIQAPLDCSRAIDDAANCETSVGREIHEPCSFPTKSEVHCSENCIEITDSSQAIETETINTNLLGVDHLSICNEVEDERMTDTPTSIEGIHSLHMRFFFERREFGTESLDGSVASEIEAGETSTVDLLKSALRTERKALIALYAEFEEERSASTIAANQTMAMITRLQEEKAAMQMEALQYQRMMEEQAEYDQESLELLNELLIQREEEKQVLEKELQVYQKRVLLYEAKERRKTSERCGTSSTSSSAEDSDDLSFGSHETDECFEDLKKSNQYTPPNHVSENVKSLINLDGSFVDFEEERVSILEQLKALEEKLFTMDEEAPNSLDTMDHFSKENGHGLNGDYKDCGFSNNLAINGKLHNERKNTSCRGKVLNLPFFELICMEKEEELCANQEETDASPESISKYAIVDHEKLVVAEEVDNVHERLISLEADGEILKHCISSLKKGDKGMDLLQVILYHLRDLKNVELLVKNVGDELTFLST